MESNNYNKFAKFEITDETTQLIDNKIQKFYEQLLNDHTNNAEQIAYRTISIYIAINMQAGIGLTETLMTLGIAWEYKEQQLKKDRTQH